MKKNIILVFVALFSLNGMAQTRSRYIGAPGDQGNIQFYDEGTTTNIMTFTSGGVIISNLTTAGSFSIPAGSVGSAEIANYAIVNANIASAAAIAGSKLDMTNGTGRIIATGRAVTYAGDTTDIMILSGSGTNGQIVTFTQPFINTPTILCNYGVGVGGTNAYPVSANPTNFTIGGQAGITIDWIARGNR